MAVFRLPLIPTIPIEIVGFADHHFKALKCPDPIRFEHMSACPVQDQKMPISGHYPIEVEK